MALSLNENSRVIVRLGLIPVVVIFIFGAGVKVAAFWGDYTADAEGRDSVLSSAIETNQRAIETNQRAIEANHKSAAIEANDRIRGSDFDHWLQLLKVSNPETNLSIPNRPRSSRN